MITVLIINNDRLSRIERDPDFGSLVADASNVWFGRGEPQLERLGYGKVLTVAHADHELFLHLRDRVLVPIDGEDIAAIYRARRAREKRKKKAEGR